LKFRWAITLACLVWFFSGRKSFMYPPAVVCLGLMPAVVCGSEPAVATQPEVEKGEFLFSPAADCNPVPNRYRLGERSFTYELTHRVDLPSAEVRISHLTFPSPVETAQTENNTVHAEYYRPLSQGSFPAVIVLDITAGDQRLSRSIATYLAQHQVCALFVQMAYYGPRRPPGSRLRLLMPNIEHSLAAIRQTVLDLRVATAWLQSRPEVDSTRVGILGTSLGSFMATLTAEMEPKLGRLAVLLGGGGVVDAYYDHPQAAPYRKVYEALGGTKEKLAAIIAPADPLTCASNLKERRVLILAGKRDEIVPPRMAEALWRASGQQRIVWFDCTHYGAVAYIAQALRLILDHFSSR
jgi:dienelactone hydrolase